MAGLRLTDLRKSYGSIEVIKGVDLDVSHGEFVVFVGPSGCGKSTLLRMIAGLEDITGGELWIGEKLCNTVEPRDRRIAMVFQNYALLSAHDSLRQCRVWAEAGQDTQGRAGR
jgi:multiple sugar transport system ATP-binding protein